MISVRVAEQGDIAGVDALLARAYPVLLKPDYAPSVLVTALPIIARVQPDLVTCGTFFVAVRDDHIVGGAGWTAVIPGSSRIEPGRANVRHVVTDDRVVRQGIGRLLLERVLETARGAGHSWMHCKSTITAVPFYEAMGFRVSRRMNVVLGAGIDFPAVEMGRSL